MSKSIEVWEFVEGDESPAGYYADGHHSPEDFIRAIKARYRKQTGGNYPEKFPAHDVRQVYCRMFPIEPDLEDSDSEMEFFDNPGVGSPMTVVFTVSAISPRTLAGANRPMT